VFFSVVTRMGWPEEDAALMRRLVQMYPHCVLRVDGFAVWLWTTMLSGVMSTDLIQGVLTWLHICICFHILVRMSFRAHVALVCLGDDHIGGVSPLCRELFVPEGLCELLALVGHVYTNADKTRDFSKFYKTRSDVRFL